MFYGTSFYHLPVQKQGHKLLFLRRRTSFCQNTIANVTLHSQMWSGESTTTLWCCHCSSGRQNNGTTFKKCFKHGLEGKYKVPRSRWWRALESRNLSTFTGTPCLLWMLLRFRSYSKSRYLARALLRISPFFWTGSTKVNCNASHTSITTDHQSKDHH